MAKTTFSGPVLEGKEGVNIETKASNYTVTTSDSGKTFVSETDGVVFTLPAIAVGYSFKFANNAPDGAHDRRGQCMKQMRASSELCGMCSDRAKMLIAIAHEPWACACARRHRQYFVGRASRVAPAVWRQWAVASSQYD